MMKSNNILIVEDELIATHYLKKILNSFGFTSIFEAKNSKDAQDIVKKVKIDLVFMDINIQGAIDGIECTKLLNQSYFLPTIFTTAHNDSQTIQEASSTNVFGYLSKPFDEKDVEITLSVANNILKNLPTQNQKKQNISKKTILTLNSLYSYDLDTKTLFIDNTPIKLTKKELEILYIFCTNINTNISYESFRESIWNSSNISNSTIRDTISRMRKKMEYLNIENIINYGYILRV